MLEVAQMTSIDDVCFNIVFLFRIAENKIMLSSSMNRPRTMNFYICFESTLTPQLWL